jgi:hypothetical protein
VEQVREKLIETFERWGKPGAMRVDNGTPFGDPSGMTTSALSLWLIAVDVDMIWNHPRRPQQNARVEKMQDTTARWAEIQTAGSCQQLQEKLTEVLRLQRESYPVERLGGKTRLVAFPALETSRRPYAASDFQSQKVYAFLCQKLYTRKVASNGQLSHYGQLFYVAYGLREQWVQLRLTGDGKYWQVIANYKVIKELPATHLTPERIRNLTVCQRTNCAT